MNPQQHQRQQSHFQAASVIQPGNSHSQEEEEFLNGTVPHQNAVGRY